MDYTTRIGRIIKTIVGGETVSAYLPNDLPPSPPLELSETLIELMQVASQSLGRLDGASLLTGS